MSISTMSISTSARTLGLLIGLAVSVSTTAAFAFETKPFDDASFKATQAAGKAAVVHVTAPWCPTCKAQETVLQGMATDPAYAALTVFKVDFDSQEPVMKRFNARTHSTLIAFSGAEETGRVVGQTSPAAIASVFASTAKH